jgi:hypothetical protein
MQTKGQQFAKDMRKNLGIGSRTRRTRNGIDLHADILECIRTATYNNGWYSEQRTDLFRAAFGAQMAYEKHIAGYRVDPSVQRYVSELSPYQFCNLLGRMVDAGISNVGEGELFFQQLRAELYAQAA